MIVKVSEGGRFRGLIGKSNRIVIPKKICQKIKIEPGTFFEGVIYGEDKILLTFIKYMDGN